MGTTPLDASYVRGTHGRLPDSAEDTPLVLCSDTRIPEAVSHWVEADAGQVPASAVKGLVLDLQGVR